MVKYITCPADCEILMTYIPAIQTPALIFIYSGQRMK